MAGSCFAVLLKNGILAIVECASAKVFDLARERNAGICGVFSNRQDADEFVSVHSFIGHQRREAFLRSNIDSFR
jgi:hypothetical protein